MNELELILNLMEVLIHSYLKKNLVKIYASLMELDLIVTKFNKRIEERLKML